jgi:hypothetical protein
MRGISGDGDAFAARFICDTRLNATPAFDGGFVENALMPF